MSSAPPSPSPSPELNNRIEETEKQVWEILRSIPGLNVTYGSVRCIVYIVKNNKKESTDSAIGVAKGAIQTGAIAAGIFAAPVTIPIASGVLTGIAAKSVSDTLEVIVFFVTNAEQFGGEAGSDEKEAIFYDKIKNVAGVGAIYSAIRAPIYLCKKNKQKSMESGVSFLANSGEIAVQAGIRTIPNMDDQLQKVLEKTSKYAIKFFAKKIMAQVAQQKLPLELGLETIANVETDLQTIMDLATDSTTLKLDSDDEEHSKVDNIHREVADVSCPRSGGERKKQTWSFIPRCFRKNDSVFTGETGNVSNVNKVSNNCDQSQPCHSLNTCDNDDSNGHVLILTQ